MKKTSKNRFYVKTLIVVLAVILLGVTWVFAFPYKANPWVEHDNISFDITYDEADEHGFVDSWKNNLTDTEKVVASNDKFELLLDQTTSYFAVKNKDTGALVQSNPTIADPRGPAGAVATRQKATIEYYTVNENGTESARNDNYAKSIYHVETANPDETGKSTFKLKELDNGFQVFYKIAEDTVDHLFFPLYLEPELYEPILARDRTDSVRNALVQVYSDVVDEDTGLYKAGVYEGMRLQRRNALYEIFYVDKLFGDYSRERAIEENAENGYHEVATRFGFEIALQITLEEDGIEITVIDESINEYDDSGSRLSRISLYPHFGTAIDTDPITNESKEGYIVIPDGSGAVIEFSEEEVDTTVYSATYSKRLYGQDLAKLPIIMAEDQQDITLPLYGMVKDDIGFAAIITQGSAQTTINAGLAAVNNDSYYKVYPTFHLRESESTVLGGGWDTHRVNIWTGTRTQTDYAIKYVLLSGETNNYVGIAKAYQNYLIEENGLVKKDETTSNKVILDLLGSYDTRKFFLGVPYKSYDSLTTFKQAELIVEELKELGVNNMDVIYNGIDKDGLNNGLDNKVKISSKLGGKKGFEKLETNLSESNINIYPRVNVLTTNDYNRTFDHFKYSSRRIIGELARDFNYHVPTKLPMQETGYEGLLGHYVINPVYYETLFNSKNKSYRYDNLFLQGIGSNLTSSFNKNNELFKEQSLLIHNRLLSKVTDQNIVLSNPVGPLMHHANLITDLAVDTTLYTMFDYSIPLIQLVLSGFIDYTAASINMPSERDVQYKFLKALETGSNLKYTLSYDNSLKLLETPYNNYMSTEYVNWLEDIQNHNNIINELDIHNATLVGHTRVANNVYESTYSNGLVLVINFGINTAVVDGINIPSLDYIVKEVI